MTSRRRASRRTRPGFATCATMSVSLPVKASDRRCAARRRAGLAAKSGPRRCRRACCRTAAHGAGRCRRRARRRDYPPSAPDRDRPARCGRISSPPPAPSRQSRGAKSRAMRTPISGSATGLSQPFSDTVLPDSSSARCIRKPTSGLRAELLHVAGAPGDFPAERLLARRCARAGGQLRVMPFLMSGWSRVMCGSFPFLPPPCGRVASAASGWGSCLVFGRTPPRPPSLCSGVDLPTRGGKRMRGVARILL